MESLHQIIMITFKKKVLENVYFCRYMYSIKILHELISGRA